MVVTGFTSESDEKERGVIFTPKVEEEGRIDELPMVDTGEQLDEPNVSSVLTPEEIAKFGPAPEEKNEEVLENVDNSADDLNKKTYLKIASTFYIKPAGTEKNKEGEDVKLYKVLNPETNVVEKRQLTDIEKHDIIVHDLKESRIKFNPIKSGVKTTVTTSITPIVGNYRKISKEKSVTILTNVTTNQFGADYRKKRKNKNRMARASRKANR
jgi:hypothetical protein